MDLTSLGFDRYQRFTAASEALDELAGGKSLRVLDVGDFDASFAGFAPRHHVRPWAEHVSREGGGLPWPDRSLDACVALDVLEHVPPGERDYFLGELARVSRLGMVISFPAPAAAEAEAFVLQITGSAWLAEHAVHGLPDPDLVEARLASLDLDFERRPNAALPSWTAMMLLMYGVQDPELRGKISQHFNTRYYALENREPAYRHLYLCRRHARAHAREHE